MNKLYHNPAIIKSNNQIITIFKNNNSRIMIFNIGDLKS